MVNPSQERAEDARRAQTAAHEEPSISATDIHVVFRGGRRNDEGITALRGANIEIGPREFVSLLGPSGCGKTTLMKVLCGLIRPTSGTVTINGETVDEALNRRAFGVVPQRANLLPWRRVLENAELLTEVVGRKRSSREEVKQLLAQVGLAGFEDRYPHELSGGMQQRIGIVRALSLNPDILLMDEPFAAVDALTRDDLGELLLRVWGRARPVVFITHSIEEAVYLSDRVVVMSARPGRILETIDIDLPRPRDGDVRYSMEFNDLAQRIRVAVNRAQNRG